MKHPTLNFNLGPGEKIELNKAMWNNIRKMDPESDLMHCYQLQDAATGKIKDCFNLDLTDSLYEVST